MLKRRTASAGFFSQIWDNKIVKGFSSKYNTNKLVYFEQYNDIIAAISREKLLKEYKRQWKLNLIESQNPEWHDLNENRIT